jgi:hypothetical protein
MDRWTDIQIRRWLDGRTDRQADREIVIGCLIDYEYTDNLCTKYCIQFGNYKLFDLV